MPFVELTNVSGLRHSGRGGGGGCTEQTHWAMGRLRKKCGFDGLMPHSHPDGVGAWAGPRLSCQTQGQLQPQASARVLPGPAFARSGC